MIQPAAFRLSQGAKRFRWNAVSHQVGTIVDRIRSPPTATTRARAIPSRRGCEQLHRCIETRWRDPRHRRRPGAGPSRLPTLTAQVRPTIPLARPREI
jgi:hypothetical protein